MYYAIVFFSFIALNSYLSFLRWGLGFAYTPISIPKVDFLIEIEKAIQTLPNIVTNEIRQDCVVTLRRAKPPKCNVPKVDFIAFKNPMKNDDIVIVKVGKGNAVVILDKQDYVTKMLDHLSNGGSYRTLPKTTPISKIIKKVKLAISPPFFLWFHQEASHST